MSCADAADHQGLDDRLGDLARSRPVHDEIRARFSTSDWASEVLCTLSVTEKSARSLPWAIETLE